MRGEGGDCEGVRCRSQDTYFITVFLSMTQSRPSFTSASFKYCGMTNTMCLERSGEELGGRDRLGGREPHLMRLGGREPNLMRLGGREPNLIRLGGREPHLMRLGGSPIYCG